MPHRVRITREAEGDLRSIGDFIAQRAPQAARRFVATLRRQIATLKTFPARHGKAPEAQEVDVDLRQLMHGMYRVLYTFDETTVVIHAVRHGARRPLRHDELTGQP